jgi:uncharacterized membrane protein YfcA
LGKVVQLSGNAMLEFSTIEWVIVILCALLIGFSKTGIPGTGILMVPLMAMVMPARQSTGFVLPMLAMADIMAIVYWRRHVEVRHLIRLLPWAWLGVIVGAIGLHTITNAQLRPTIGTIVLVLIIGSWIRERFVDDAQIPAHWLFAAVMGVLAGSTSMMANAAGPIMIIYLMAMRLAKREFIGTGAWFFWILNLSKLPFSSKLSLISRASLVTNVSLLPVLLLGGVLGIFLVHRVPQRAFDVVVKALAMASALYLCVSAWVHAG